MKTNIFLSFLFIICFVSITFAQDNVIQIKDYPSPYLIGTYNVNDANETFIQVVNPTNKELQVITFFFDDDEKFIKHFPVILTPLDFYEIDVRNAIGGNRLGVVVVLSYNQKEKKPMPGVVGYQVKLYSRFGHITDLKHRIATESPLQPISLECLRDNLKYITKGIQ